MYKVKRHIMFYPRDSEVTIDQLRKFFTEKAISEFKKYGFIEKITNV